MERGKIVKPVAVTLGCAGAAVAAPFLAPYLATVSVPFFGAVLAGVFKAEDFTDNFGKVIVNTAAGFLTGIGGSAIDKIPGTLGDDHNFHLEKMLATAYLESLAAVEREIEAGADERLQEQAAEVFPLLKARIERGLRAKELFLLFPLQTKDQPVDKAFANRFSAEKISLLIADEERWREQLGDEVEIALRRWLNEERAARQKQLGLSSNVPLPEPLHSRLRAELPHRIAHRISELVKREDFKESWIAFQRAHLQGIARVVERIETSQADIKGSVDALAKRIEGFANQDEFVTAIAGKLEEFLSKSHLPQAELALMLEQQSDTLIVELRGLEERLGRKLDENKGELIGEIRGAKDELKEFQKEILEGAIRATQRRLKQLPAPPHDFIGREVELAELRQALRQGGVTISGVQGMGGVGKTALALKLAHEFKDRYADAQIYLDLKGVSQQPLSHAEIMWHVVSSFQPEMKQPDDDQLPAWYNSLLNEHRVLLFYDNAKDAAQIEPLLPPENCLLLVTSRKQFRLPGMCDKDLNKMTEADAEALLLEIAPRIAADAAAIAKQCDYLPVALRLAASALHKSRALSPSDLVRRLQDKQQRVALVEASFSLSYELLTEELQRRWRMLAIFPGDFDAPAAATVWQIDVDHAKDALAELEEYSLLEWEESARRYSLHDLARDFADTCLNSTEREQAGVLHATHYLQILSTADDLFLKGNEAIAEGLSLFDNERVNIEAGQAWAAARFAGNEPAARLCNWYPADGVYVLNLRQHPRDFIYWQETALRAAKQLHDRQSEGSHLGNLGNAYSDLGEIEKAIEFMEAGLKIFEENESPNANIVRRNLEKLRGQSV
ncbi:hypothetical protein BH18ACI2_BH18ACI2_05850 [soil metagenome]